ncbi:MAG: SDR family oxidoreductase [Thermomicrobiales bacterium]
MAARLKKLEDQIVVITGASSGIGLVTARMATERGARLVLAARSEGALRQLTEESIGKGGSATYVVADVSKREDVQEIARVATETFGGFDTWVNDAGVGIYGKLAEIPIEDMRQLFDTNFWGIVYGSGAAAAHLKQRGGALINLGSVVSERAVPLQGIYSASKHAIKGFTDALRMELEWEGAPISVTLIKPSSIDTPYMEHAKNSMDKEATLPPPVYAPHLVAETILHAAEHPDGAGGASLAVMGDFAPRLTDKVMEMIVAGQEKRDRPAGPREENGLDHAAGRLEERGGYEGHTIETSPYTQAKLHPVVTGAAIASVSAAGRRCRGLASVAERRAATVAMLVR